MQAFVLINVRAGKNPDVVRALRRIKGVKMAHICWGRPDIFALVYGRNEKALRDAVLGKIQTIAGIESTETHVVVD